MTDSPALIGFLYLLIRRHEGMLAEQHQINLALKEIAAQQKEKITRLEQQVAAFTELLIVPHQGNLQ